MVGADNLSEENVKEQHFHELPMRLNLKREQEMKRIHICILVMSISIWPLQGITEPGKGAGKNQQWNNQSEMHKQTEQSKDQHREQQQIHKEEQRAIQQEKQQQHEIKQQDRERAREHQNDNLGNAQQQEMKREQQQKELGKGSEQGQASRENRRKWWQFWGEDQ